jgi:hypothetical protein
MKETAGQPPAIFTGKWILILLFCSAPIFVLFASHGHPGMGRAAFIGAGVIVVAIRATWHLRRYVWFWITVAAIIAVHIVVVLRFPWSETSYPGFTLLLPAALDFAIVYGCFKLMEKIISAGDSAGSKN